MAMPFYLPVVRVYEYEALQKIMGNHLSYSFNQWLDVGTKWSAKWSKDGVAPINIDPDEFRLFTMREKRVPDINALLAFAEKIGKGESQIPS